MSLYAPERSILDRCQPVRTKFLTIPPRFSLIFCSSCSSSGRVSCSCFIFSPFTDKFSLGTAPVCPVLFSKTAYTYPLFVCDFPCLSPVKSCSAPVCYVFAVFMDFSYLKCRKASFCPSKTCLFIYFHTFIFESDAMWFQQFFRLSPEVCIFEFFLSVARPAIGFPFL